MLAWTMLLAQAACCGGPLPPPEAAPAILPASRWIASRPPQDQFLLLDALYTHTTETKGFSYFPLPVDVPDNWKAPFDFANGAIHFRLEVLSKPSDKPVNYQFCVFQDQHSSSKHACDGTRTFTAPTVIEWKSTPSSIWQSNVIDWGRRLLDTMLVIKDKDGNPVDDRYGFGGKWNGSPDFSLYFPMTVRITAVVVAKGAAYNPAAASWRIGDVHWRDLIHLKGVAAAWERGQIGQALAGAEKELDSKDGARAEEARKVIEAIRTWTDRQLREIDGLKFSVPDAGAAALARLAQRLAPSAMGKELSARAKEWEKDPAVLQARKAKPLYDLLREAASRVRGKGKAADPDFARRFGGELQSITQLAGRIRREFPETVFARQAAAIAAEFGLRVPE